MKQFSPNAKESFIDDENPKERRNRFKGDYVVEIQDNNPEYRPTCSSVRGNEKPIDDSVMKMNTIPTIGTDEAEEDAEDVELNPFRIEIDLQTYQIQKQKDSKENREEKPIAEKDSFESDEDSLRAPTKLFCFVGALILTVIIVTVVAILITSRMYGSSAASSVPINPSSNDQNSSGQSDEITTEDIRAYILDALKENSRNIISESHILNSTTPQGRAFMSLVLELQLSGSSDGLDISSREIQQRYALAVLYYSTSNSTSSWTIADGWKLLESNECQWYGLNQTPCISNNEGDHIVTKILLPSNNLVGTIPSEICFLREDLSALDLSGNQLSGTIPDCFMDLTRLSLLRLDHNRLKGTLPAMGLPHLQEFDVSHNHLSGSLNSMFVATSNLSAGSQKFESTLTIMRLNDNRFSGTIPELKGASSLATLTLTGNHLTGQVPCQSLSLYENQTSNAENQISPIKTLEVDCEKVTCTCCTNCYKSWCVSDNC